ncbi:MAG: lysine--tRNA ligase [Holosporales bacterium]
MQDHFHIETFRAEEDNDFRAVRLKKLQQLLDMGINPYPATFKKSRELTELHQHYESLEAGQETQDSTVIAGRIASIRNSGLFIDLTDPYTKLQVFCHADHLDDQAKALLPLLDLGDILGVEGLVRRTKRGELTVDARSLTLLSKATLPPPEKFHGLADQETKYRQRYLDLIANAESRERLRARSQLIRSLRDTLNSQGFMEVETPMLQTIAGGAAARPFVTHHNTLDMDLYLRIAPELFLKRLIVGGLADKVYELNRCFRNEGISTRHNPEFTMVEMYWAYADADDMMNLTEKLVQTIAQQVFGTLEFSYGERQLNFAGPWQRRSMVDLVREHSGIDFLAIHSPEEARTAAKAIGISTPPHANWGQVIEAVFAEKVEPTLIQPTHVTDLPRDISPLAKVHKTDPRLTERFESFANTWEIANGFSELSDPIDQWQRFHAQTVQRDKGDDEAHQMDEDFVTALEYGLPPTGGLGIGIDRLCMLLTNASSIRDVIAFPTMRSKS